MNKEVLEELILNINNRTGIRNEILEKDYYVCLVLKQLSLKQKKLQAYFKGGTAVYKILDHMNRFSEDIDLTVKVNENESNNSNINRLKKSAFDYSIKGLELVEEEKIDKKGSVIGFYKYESLFSLNELFKSERVQIESTSFTVSEPIATYTIEPLVYKYASYEEKEILKEQFNISEFDIEIIKLERIFVDKLFAAEFYYERNMYGDVAKHLYDICILMKSDTIKNLLKEKEEFNKLIRYKRKEELSRVGGIDSSKELIDFAYMKLEFNNELINAFNDMQRIYVLDEESKITIDDVKEAIRVLYENIDKVK